MTLKDGILKHIKNNDFTMLPGIGAMIADYSSPYLDQNSEIIHPVREIRLNSLLRDDTDISLLNALRSQLGIDDNEIQKRYFDFLDEFDQSIEETGSYYWEGVGRFLAGDHLLEFIADQNLIRNVDIPEIDDKYTLSTTEIETKFTEDKSFDSQESMATEQPRDLNKEGVTEEDYSDYEDKNPKEKSLFLKFLLFLLPLALLAGAWFYTVFIKPSKQIPVKEESTKFQEAEIENLPEEIFELDTITNELKPESIQERPVPIKQEHIVSVAIYKTNEDADIVATVLAENGYPSRVRPYGPLFKVYLVASSKEQAFQYVEEVEKLINVKPVYQE